MNIQLKNRTPYLPAVWNYLNQQGEEFGVALLRGRFLLKLTDDKTWELEADKDQGDLFSQDIFYGEANESSIRYESDYIPYKSGTDIIANATARSPKKKQLRQWLCGIQIQDSKEKILASKILQVTGKRAWKRNVINWKLTEPSLCNEVPIRYESSYGGGAIKYDEQGNFDRYLDFDNRNPIGIGNIHESETSGVHPAPRIESPNNPITNALDINDPEGFGFITRSWQPRLALAGTYDDTWLKEKHPLLPNDFDIEHHRAASSGLALSEYLKGGEKVSLKHFLSDIPLVEFTLPKFSFYSTLQHNDGGLMIHPLELDTLLFDINEDDINTWRVYISWRGQHLLPDSAIQLELSGIDREAETNE